MLLRIPVYTYDNNLCFVVCMGLYARVDRHSVAVATPGHVPA